MKIKKLFKALFVMMMVFGLSFVFFVGESFGTAQGPGSTGGDATTTTCNTATHIKNTDQCNDNYGGASWHIFKISNGVTKVGDVDSATIVTSPTSSVGVTYTTSEKFMNEGGYDGNLSTKCPASQYDYYLAYVYDGWRGYNLTGGPVFYGPLQWRVACGEINGHCNKPVYHTRNSLSHSEALARIKANNNVNTIRLGGSHPTSSSDSSYVSADALWFYQKYCAESKSCDENATEIPKIGYFCMPTSVYKATLTAYAKYGTGDNEYLNNHRPIDSQTVSIGNNATVDSAKYDEQGYTWSHWGSSGVCAGANKTRKCTASMDANHVVNGYYDKNEWQAQSIVSRTSNGSAIATAGYASSTPSPTPSLGYIDNCDPVNGCKVYFRHNIKRVKGSGTTAYTVSRNSNLTKSDDSARGIDGNTSVATGNSNTDDSVKQASSSGPFTLYPGMIVCERITFRGFNVPGSTDQHTEVCAIALGKSQPDDPPSDTPEDPGAQSGDTSFVNIKVRNNTVDAYKKYQRLVYAKPTDKISYRAVYNPNLQYVYKIKAKNNRMKVQIDSGSTKYNGEGKAIGTIFNEHKNPNWNNDFVVSSSFADSDRNYQHSVNNTPGDSSKKTDDIPGTNSFYTVKGTDVGKSLKETITVNNGSITQKRGSGSNDSRTTPIQVEFNKDPSDSRVSIANVKTTPAPSKEATAKVPYNYRNDTRVNNTNKIVYAGETLTVKHDYIINPKPNRYTSPNTPYITNIGDPQWKIGIRVVGGDSYWTRIHKPGSDNNKFAVSESEMYQTKTIPTETTINIPDVPAGTTICVRSAVYPRDSGTDDNLNKNAYGINDDRSWKKSDEVCFTVAKRPSIEVWGGNIYTRGKVTTATSTKNNLAGYSDYSYKVEDNDNGVRVFGSFGELGLIASGQVTGLASGASMGFASNNNGVLSPNPLAEVINTNPNTPANASNPGGSKKSSICDRSPLTFANSPCGTLGQLGKTATTTNMEDDKNNVLGKFIRELDSSNTGSPVVLNDRSKVQSDGTYYYYSNSDLEVGTGGSKVTTSIDNSTIQVVHSKNTLYVKGNLAYNETYQKYSELPKLVLYGKNVVIECDVTRIDALIIADEKVVTCNNFSDDNGNSDVNSGSLFDNAKNHINERANSNQLIINGAIVTKTLVANRTYGAASGANSIVPAEIINFDPTLYMWGGLGNDEGSDGDLEVTLTKELAPRR